MATVSRHPTINLPYFPRTPTHQSIRQARKSDPEPPTPPSPLATTSSSSYFNTDPWLARLESARRRAEDYSAKRYIDPDTDVNTDSDSDTVVQHIFGINNSKPKKRIRMSNGSEKRKIIIMGSPSVGKTSLTQQYVTPPTYNEAYFPTIEATSHKMVTFEGVEYECEIIDSAGQDEYTLFPSKYAVGVHGYLLVYSINSRQTFEMIQTVHDKILDFAGVEKVPCVIVGQKCDLGGERRVTTAEGETLAKKLHAGFVESSAKDNKNVGKAFEVLLGEMQKLYNPAPEKKKSSWFSWGK